MDGPPGTPQETYTVQSKKKTDEGEKWQAIVAINSSTAHNLQPNTPTPSAKNSEPRRRTQSLHGPKPLNEPFLVLSRNKKRFISQAAATASKKRIVSDDLKASPKDTVQRTLFKKELAEISAASNRNLAAYTTNRGFVTLNQKSELKNEIAIFEGQESNDKKVTTTGFDDLTDCEYLFNSDYEEFPTPKRRRRTGSGMFPMITINYGYITDRGIIAKITVIEGYTTSDIKDESTVD